MFCLELFRKSKIIVSQSMDLKKIGAKEKSVQERKILPNSSVDSTNECTAGSTTLLGILSSQQWMFPRPTHNRARGKATGCQNKTRV